MLQNLGASYWRYRWKKMKNRSLREINQKFSLAISWSRLMFLVLKSNKENEEKDIALFTQSV